MEAACVSLQERLQLIQQQQRERFKTRKSLKIKENIKVCPDNLGKVVSANHAGQCGLDEVSGTDTDLELRTVSQEYRAEVKTSKLDLLITKHSVKEIEYLKSCVEQLQSDNARLKSEQKQKERKIVELEKEREDERVAMGTAGATATQRIVELSKRNRELSAEVAAEKNRVRHLQKKLKESEMNTSQKGNLNDSSQPSEHKDQHKRRGDAVEKPQEDQATVIAQLQEQLQQLKLKMAEQRNQCQVLKQELKLAQRVIVKEVGEGVNMSALLSGTSGWRGRAQHIIALQSKLAELGEQLRQLQLRQNSSADVRRATSDRGATAPMVDARQKAALRKIEIDKQKNLDEARSELESLKAGYSKIQQQCSALKARNKTLTSTVKSLKEEISLAEKEDQSAGKARRSRPTCSNCDNFDMLQDIKREKQLLNKENQILRTQLEKCLTELQSLKKSMKEISPSTLQPIGSRGWQYTGHHMERKAVSAGQSLSLGSLRAHSTSDDSLMAQVSQIERERLLELTRSLQQRLDTITNKFNGLDIEMRTLRQQNARLEKMVSRNHAANVSNGSKGTSLSDPGKVEELETQLMIQMDVNAVLKETLDVTRQEKLEDMKRYQAMLQEVKLLFVTSVYNVK
jgi:DNA repair exonuclease SbcCD ATPase subunit